jgi:sirohydrochlorin cobaltochelatase
MVSGSAIGSSITLTGQLARWLSEGGSRIGELSIEKVPGGFELRHVRDREKPTAALESFNRPVDARELAKFDDAGHFRPLKSAPNLRRGWRLELPDPRAVHEALDFFYPAAIGNWVRFADGTARPVPLRETLSRQSGIYRITASLTDEQAAAVVCQTCNLEFGCLRHIPWPLDTRRPLPHLPVEKSTLAHPPNVWPLVCLEACHWLVEKARHARRKIKNPPPTQP